MHRFTVSFCFTKLKITNISEHSRVEWTVWKELNAPHKMAFLFGLVIFRLLTIPRHIFSEVCVVPSPGHPVCC